MYRCKACKRKFVESEDANYALSNILPSDEHIDGEIVLGCPWCGPGIPYEVIENV